MRRSNQEVQVGAVAVPSNDRYSEWLFEEVVNAVVPGPGMGSRHDVTTGPWLAAGGDGGGDLLVDDGTAAAPVPVRFRWDAFDGGPWQDFYGNLHTVVTALSRDDWAATRGANLRTFTDTRLALAALA